jgi:hypothetical protein
MADCRLKNQRREIVSMTPEELKARTKAGMIAYLRLPVADWSKNEIRNWGAGGGISSFDFPVSLFAFRSSSFSLCESIGNRKSAIRAD